MTFLHRFMMPWASAFLLSTATSAATLSVGQDRPYATIQEAYDVSSCGDGIVVYDGTYREQVTIAVDKGCTEESDRITIRVAEGSAATVDGEDSRTFGFLIDGDAAEAAADYITIEGFRITRAAGNGIKVYRAGHVVIRDRPLHRPDGWRELRPLRSVPL